MNTTKIMVTSGSGGVGKTSFCANLALSLARLGKRTLLCDFDVSGRALEMLLGCDTRVIRDIADIARGRATPADTLISLPRHDNLYFVAAPSDGANLFPGARDLSAALDACAEAMALDIILMDFSNIDTVPVKIAAPTCDRAIVVTRQSMISARAAEAAGYMLAERGIGDVRMVINRFSLEARGEAYPSAIELVDCSRIQLLGIIPEAATIARLEETGTLACESRELRQVKSAYKNIAERINGKNVPLLTDMGVFGRNKYLLG